VPTEWVIAGMGTIITVLSGAVALLWRNHLAADERERKRTEVAEADNRALIGEFRKALGRGASK
jgi:hypothetical protein